PVNVGKSSIINMLSGRSAAIVSPHAGTTRDVIEVHLDLGGYPITVLDTAGIRDSDDPVEQEGVRRARVRAAQADVVRWVIDATNSVPAPPPPESGTQITEAWVLVNKCDIARGLAQGRGGWTGDYKSLAISAKTGQAFDKLLAMLEDFLVNTFSTDDS